MDLDLIERVMATDGADDKTCEALVAEVRRLRDANALLWANIARLAESEAALTLVVERQDRDLARLHRGHA